MQAAWHAQLHAVQGALHSMALPRREGLPASQSQPAGQHTHRTNRCPPSRCTAPPAASPAPPAASSSSSSSGPVACSATATASTGRSGTTHSCARDDAVLHCALSPESGSELCAIQQQVECRAKLHSRQACAPGSHPGQRAHVARHPAVLSSHDLGHAHITDLGGTITAVHVAVQVHDTFRSMWMAAQGSPRQGSK